MSYQLVTKFSKQRCVWFEWPCDTTRWKDDCIPVQKEFASLCMAVSMSAPVFVMVPERDIERAGFIIPHHINLKSVSEELTYFHDNLLVKSSDKNIISCLRHTLANICEGHELWCQTYEVAPVLVDLVIPEGGFITDGKLFVGLAYLWCKANPNMTLDEISQKLGDVFSNIDVLWISSKSQLGPVPRLDSICSMGPQGVILLTWEDACNAVSLLTEKLCAELDGRVGKDGTRYHVIKIKPVDNNELRSIVLDKAVDGYAHPSYASIMPVNERVVVPLYGSMRDNDILAQMMSLFSDLDIAGVEVQEIVKGRMFWQSLCTPIPAY